MKIAMVPHVGRANPYVTLLRDALTAIDVQVTPLGTGSALRSPPNVLHYHWPQNVVAKRSAVGGLPSAAASLLRIDWLRAHGTRLIWTVHNLRAHASRSRWLENRFIRRFTRRLDGVILLDPAIRDECLNLFPWLADVPFDVIPHGVYGAADGADDSRDRSRGRLGIGLDGPLVGFVGDIHPYKGLGAALEAFRVAPVTMPALLVAGRFSSEEERRTATQLIGALRGAGANITLIERRLDDQEIVTAIRACDAILLPYLTGSNSGLAILCIEAGVPIIASGLPMFESLSQELGSYWVRTTDVMNRGDILRALDAKPGSSDVENHRRFMDERQWSSIAAKTRDFYERVDGLARLRHDTAAQRRHRLGA